MDERSFLVVGLGNIGAEYAETRHNIGCMILDAWAQASNVVVNTERYGDIIAVKDKGRTFHLLKPSTYMNLSGNAVRYWLTRLDLPVENLMVICDDINLPFGSLRMRKAGSDGGHNGLKNINELLETQAYARLRLGVGHDFSEGCQVNYVLGKFDEEQKREISEMATKIRSALKTWAFMGIDRAINEINTRKKD